MITLGMPLLWGLNKEKPVLPPGYYYIEGVGCWLIAVAPSGRHYYVAGDGILYRRGVRPITLAYCLDLRETIELPQKQLMP